MYLSAKANLAIWRGNLQNAVVAKAFLHQTNRSKDATTEQPVVGLSPVNEV